ncbi:hypothetical protein [Anaerospora sp.]|uniref:hypothetical protein n=1 Tax=Anaerospora sp. TaxID=1960278 RepID=UPI00289E39E1|nr:hypothetical protein [Anaerospora sp.]
MKKKIAAAVFGLLMAGITAVYASPVTDFEKGHVTVEFGSTLNSTFNGSGEVTGEAGGKSGFKYGVTAGLGDDWAIQFKGGKFKSEDFTGKSQSYPGVTVNTYGKSTHQEFNLIRRISPNVSAVAGWVQNKFSYSNTVEPATIASFHVGFMADQKLSEKATLFAAVLGGKDVLFWEAGVSYKIAKDAHFNVSYGERKFKNVDLGVEIPPVISLHAKEDYKLKGITCLFSVDFK